jgi:hypothetical protein
MQKVQILFLANGRYKSFAIVLGNGWAQLFSPTTDIMERL